MKDDAWTKIRNRLALAKMPLCLHELKIPGVSESAAGARLREATRRGDTVCSRVPGKRFKSWKLNEVSDIDWTQDARFMKV